MADALPIRFAPVFKVAIFATVCISLGFALGMIHGFGLAEAPIHFELCDSPPAAV